MPETDLTLMKPSNELDGLMEIGICFATSEGDFILLFVVLLDVFCVTAWQILSFHHIICFCSYHFFYVRDAKFLDLWRELFA